MLEVFRDEFMSKDEMRKLLDDTIEKYEGKPKKTKKRTFRFVENGKVPLTPEEVEEKW
jgi:hypothetical protein